MYLTHFGFTDAPFKEPLFHKEKQRCFISYFSGVELMLAHACNEPGAVALYGDDEDVISSLIGRVRQQHNSPACLMTLNNGLAIRDFEKRISEFINSAKDKDTGYIVKFIIIHVLDNLSSLHKRILRKQIDKAQERGVAITLLLAGNNTLAENLKSSPDIGLPFRTTIFIRPQRYREIQEWFRHQLQWNGRTTPLFSRLQIWRMASRCKGRLSLISQVAHYALLGAFAERSRRVKSRHLRAALGELAPAQRRYLWPGLGALLWTGLFIAAGWQLLPHTSPLLPLPVAWAHKPAPPEVKKLERIEDALDQPIAAMRQLYRVWGYDVPLEEAFCEEATRANLQCKKGEGPVSMLEKNGYPWVAELRLGERVGYANVVRSGKDDLDLLMGNKTWQVSRNWFKNAATGNYVLLYRLTPQGHSKVDAKSDASEISWLNKMLSRALMKPKNTAPGWSPALVENIKEFQRKVGIKADGQLGESTLMKLLILSGESPGLIRDKEEVKTIIQKAETREPAAQPSGTALADTLPMQKASVAMATKP